MNAKSPAAISSLSFDRRAGANKTIPADGSHRRNACLHAKGATAADLRALLAEGVASGDQVNNRLMELIRDSHDGDAFAALYDLNYRTFVELARRILGQSAVWVAPADVAQEAFLLIYRYPSKFRHQHNRSFANWSRSIILNTIRRNLRKIGRRHLELQDAGEVEDRPGRRSPLDRLILVEEVDSLKRLCRLGLLLYLYVYKRFLTPRERTALRLVEIQGVAYREAAQRIGVSYEGFKMLICRARKKLVTEIATLAARRAPHKHCAASRTAAAVCN